MEEHSRPVPETQCPPRYTLAQLLAVSDDSAPLTAEDREWVDALPVGLEVL